MAGGKWAHKVQLGREATAGTAVAATTVWRGVGANLHDTTPVTMVDEQVGIALTTNRSYIGQISGGLSMVATPATFQQLPHLLEAGIKTITPAQDGSGTDYIYAYPLGTTTVNTLKTYTLESGDNQQAEEMAYCFVEKLTLSGSRGEAVMMSADWIGRQVANSTFTGALTVPTVEEILTAKGSLFIDDIGGTIGTTAVTSTLLDWQLSIQTGWRAKFTAGSGQLYFDFNYFDKDSFKADFTATYEHNAASVLEKTDWQNQAGRLIRLSIDGSAVGTPGTTYSFQTLQIDMPTKYTEFSALEADEGNSIVKVTGSVGYNVSDALGPSITVVNELPTLP